jgi:hypothetical protein
VFLAPSLARLRAGEGWGGGKLKGDANAAIYPGQQCAQAGIHLNPDPEPDGSPPARG